MNPLLPWGPCARRGASWSAGHPTAFLRPSLRGSSACLRQNHDDAGSSAPRNRELNPPASTRPPPLTLPQRNANDSTLWHLVQTGKAYVRFYKDGLKGVWTNRKTLREKLARLPAEDRPSLLSRPDHVPRGFSRADWVLLWRVRHDMVRLPLFGLMLLVFGEFTALIVIYFDAVVPYPCRLPRQTQAGIERAEQRRRAAFAALEARGATSSLGALDASVTADVARSHIMQSLGLASRAWNLVPWMLPLVWRVKGGLRMAYLDGDDRSLIADGGPLGLDPAELVIACSERGIDTLGKSETELRGHLWSWLRLTSAEDGGERRRRVATLLLARPDDWPEYQNFALPSWEL